MIRLANASNGLAYPHDDVCLFQSQHAHHASRGYFRLDAMPAGAVIRLLRGEQIVIVDAGVRGDRLTDALRFGVPTWCGVFNRAVGYGIRESVPCPWWTDAMSTVVRSTIHRPLISTIRKLDALYGHVRPAVVGRNVLLECHGRFPADDDPMVLRALVVNPSDGDRTYPPRRS